MIRDVQGASPLIRAIEHDNTKIAKLLIRKNSEIIKTICPYSPIEYGQSTFPAFWTALHWAAWKNNKHAAKLLLENGASINVLDKQNNTPLLIAKMKNNFEVGQFLQEREQL